jgi:hypothetical protein
VKGSLIYITNDLTLEEENEEAKRRWGSTVQLKAMTENQVNKGVSSGIARKPVA